MSVVLGGVLAALTAPRQFSRTPRPVMQRCRKVVRECFDLHCTGFLALDAAIGMTLG